MMTPITLSERSNLSDIVVEGKVVSKYAQWDVNHRKIETINTIEVYTIYKGSFVTNTIELVTEGGIVGTDMLVVNPSLELSVGDYGLFSIKLNNNGQGYVTVASTQSFIKFNPLENTAKGVFDNYTNIDNLRDEIKLFSNQKEIIVKEYDLNIINNNTFKAVPVISNFSPTTSEAGTYTLLTINGSNFGATAGSVLFGNADDGGSSFITAASSLIQSWSDNQITVFVPEGASTASIKVTNSSAQTGTSSGTLTITYNISGLNSGGIDYTADLVSNNGTGGYNFTFNTSYYSNTDAVNRYEDVINQWKCETGINWKSNGASTTSTACEGSDGINVVTFDNSCALGAGVLGTCYSYYSGCSSSGKLYWKVSEIDVKFDSGTNWNYTTGAPSGAQYDFYSVMLHEMGHGHQLGHVGVSSDVMYWSISNGTMKRNFTTNNSNAGNYIMTRSNANELAYTGSTGGSTFTNVCGTGPMIYNGCSVPPTSNFSADQTGACASSLTVNFSDESTGTPTSWNWNFGDGGTSTSQNPSHNYLTAGSFDVRLITSNAFGNDTLIKTGYISLGGTAPAAACTPTTTNTGNFGTGIDRVQFHTIDNTHTANDNDGTQNFSCTNIAFVDAGSSYSLVITGDGGNAEYCRVYIDYNNDGAFAAGEIVYNQMTTKQTSHSTTVVIPSSPTVTEQNLRMRVMTDFNAFSTGCANMTYGEVEDYGVYINAPACTPPAVTSQPVNRTICVSTNTTYVVAATDAVSYQWQVNTGSGFGNISNGGVYGGATLATLTITGATIGMNGYAYRCVVTGACAPTATSNSASLTVNATNTASAGSSTPTLCINTLMTNITHTTTGATGIGAASGLPTGVTANWASNTITISGTPSASGTFNYSIPLTGGCGTVNATGTIVVNPFPGNAGAITGSTSECDNTTSVAYSISSVSGATGYNWTVPSGATVASGQNTTSITVDFGVTSGDVTVTPTNSCGNGGQANKAVTIAPCGSAPVANFSTNTTTICAGESVNFTDLSTNTPTSWSWNFGDGGSSTSQNTTYTYNTPGTYTVTLTATNASGSDDEVKTDLITVNVIDDASFNYSVSTYCQDGIDPTPTILGTTGGTFTRSPVGLIINSSTGIIDLSASTTGTYTVTYTTSGFCADVQNVQVTIVNCGSTELKPIYRKTYVSYSEKLACYIVSGAQDYEWEFVPVGGGATLNYVRGNNNPSILLGWITSIQDGITYNVRIRANVGGVFGSFGNAWQITTPGASSQTQIVPTYCGKVYTSYAELLNAYTVSNATEYEFEFSPVGGGSVVNHVHTSNSILLSWVVGLVDNTSYNVRVRAKVSGSFGSYGPSCQITTPTMGLTSLKPEYCGVVYASMSAKIACYAVTGAEDYEFEFTPVGGGTPLLDTNISTSPSTLLNRIIGIQPSTAYNVRVRAKLSGVYQAFGSSCQITTPSSAMVLNETARLMPDNENETKDGLIIPSTTLSIYPNPNSGEQLNVNLENLIPNSTLTISDIYGKIILTKPLNTNQSEYKVNVKFDNKLTAGLYFITILSDENRIVEKMIVR